MTKKNKISYAQKELPFNGEARALKHPLTCEWQALTAATLILIALVLVYGYSLVNSIAQVSLRETALKESRALAAERATLEGTFLAKTNGITEEYARSLGYQDVGERIFLSKALSYASDAR